MNIDIRLAVCGVYRENAYAVGVAGRDDCVLIDPGDDLEAVSALLDGRAPGAILITHGHFDHTLAAAPLAARFGAPVYVHALDREMLTDSLLNAYDPDAASLPALPRELEAREFGDTLSVCGMDFQVLHTPGHSRGSVCLYLSEPGLLFSGDTLFEAGFGRMDLYGGDVNQMRDSLRQLFGLPGGVKVYPGHGDATTIAREAARYRL